MQVLLCQDWGWGVEGSPITARPYHTQTVPRSGDAFFGNAENPESRWGWEFGRMLGHEPAQGRLRCGGLKREEKGGDCHLESRSVDDMGKQPDCQRAYTDCYMSANETLECHQLPALHPCSGRQGSAVILERETRELKI